MRARQSTATFLSCVNYCDDAYKPTVRIMTCLQHLHFLQRVLVFTMYYPSPQYHRNLKMEIDFSRKALKPLDRIQNVQCVSHHCHIFWTELATQLVNFCCSCSSSTCVSNLGFVLLMHLEHILIILHTVPKPHLGESLDFWRVLDKNWTFNKVWFWWFWQQKSTFDSGHTFWSLEGRTNQMNFWNIYNLAAHCILRP